MNFLQQEPEWLTLALTSLLILIGGGVLAITLFRVIKAIVRKQKHPIFKKLSGIIQYPFKALIVLIAINFVRLNLENAFPEYNNLGHIMYMIFLAVFAWLAISIVNAVQAGIVAKYDVEVADNLKARKIHTQLKVFKNIVIFLILFFTISVALLSFSAIRQLGVSLLASAGVAGIILGFAAQKSISMLLSGFQLAITQPIRLDDVVIVEGEWGRIEEITLTYVVVAIWDKRRMVLPVTYFIDQPFENWTRQSSEILGTVYLYVDYGLPVDKLREFMTEALNTNPHWDGQVNVLQVTDCSEKTMELRALASAKDSGIAWDLRVRLREDLIGFIQKNYPQYLPQNRISMEEKSGKLST